MCSCSYGVSVETRILCLVLRQSKKLGKTEPRTILLARLLSLSSRAASMNEIQAMNKKAKKASTMWQDQTGIFVVR